MNKQRERAIAQTQKDTLILSSFITEIGEDRFSRALAAVMEKRLKPKGKRLEERADLPETIKKKASLEQSSFSCGIDHLQYSKGTYYSHPYPMNMEDFRRLTEICDRNSMTFHVSPRSWYNFGQTLLIEISRITKAMHQKTES